MLVEKITLCNIEIYISLWKTDKRVRQLLCLNMKLIQILLFILLFLFMTEIYIMYDSYEVLIELKNNKKLLLYLTLFQNILFAIISD